MSRQARVVAVGVPHHITHRGNNSQDVFLSDEDRRRYQTLLRDQLAPSQIDLLGWCWMSNHVHLIAVPHHQDSLARLIRATHSRYAQDFNRRWNRNGHLWRSRFYSCALGPSHLEAALLYVDLNPVRAQLVGDPLAWPWSSAGAHTGAPDATGLLSRQELARWSGCHDWAERLRLRQAESTLTTVRRATQAGTPFCDVAFRRELERQTGRRLDWKPRGRPARSKARTAAVGLDK